ncbi:hypothetical protein F4777DRAFT_598266 [Nemania sp. FL0916]|nr:hypothetical protein F4777DRAFT_598266 [Nemania sp. FL0916]
MAQDPRHSDLIPRPRTVRNHYTDKELEGMISSAVLRKSLSANSTIATESSFATRVRNDMVHPADTQNYQEIGAGLQGIIYEQQGTSVVKKERLGNQGRPLVDEFAMHQTVASAFAKYKKYSGGVRVPEPYNFFPRKSLCPELLSRLPENDRTPSDIVTMERILPLPKVVRKAMIRQFYPDEIDGCDEHVIARVLNERANKHCLARVYLGTEKVTMTKENFTLRNFPLTLDIIRKLSSNSLFHLRYFATLIGNAYAIMHWAAHITGDDVEFVLGTSTSTNPNDTVQERDVHMYLLDFGQCDTVDMNGDQDDIFQAFKGSMVLQQNQIYLPHPKKSTEIYRLWKSAYLSTAKKIVHEEGLPFDPEEFLSQYEDYLEDFDP